ncbi:DUF2993 domain-containing protein [Streptomyces oceani]|uniref:DUF2993 domain-containing protein n=1 Tax=Streptomyces oceani TaxID=1075402 RepID=A0A1E7KM36_9ACTN|nr:DUF2993 domain-containing protein [Streptomyces oceani]OEV05042.1 hypothetical protein AN216_04670 [Streptomyces oceani]
MRALRFSLVVLLVLGGLFVAADRVAVYLAESEAADKVRSSQGLAEAESASVSIHGFPFLTQVVGQELDDVDVRLEGMTVAAGGQRVKVSEVDVALSKLAMGDSFDIQSAERATGVARLSYANLQAIAPKGVHVTHAGAERAAKNQVRIKASVDILGRRVDIPKPMYSTVRVTDDGRLLLRAESIPGSSIPGAEEEIRKVVDFEEEVRGLPAGMEMREAEVTEDGLAFQLRGSNVDLTG